jgi:hypothetical protein
VVIGAVVVLVGNPKPKLPAAKRPPPSKYLRVKHLPPRRKMKMEQTTKHILKKSNDSANAILKQLKKMEVQQKQLLKEDL